MIFKYFLRGQPYKTALLRTLTTLIPPRITLLTKNRKTPPQFLAKDNGVFAVLR